jgi:hypothetical protein
MKNKTLRSRELAWVFFEVLHDNPFTLTIAKKLGKGNTTIAYQLYDLQKAGLIKQGRRDKAQHHLIDKEGVVKKWKECLIDYLHYKNLNVGKKIENIFSRAKFQNFMINYLYELNDSTIETLDRFGEFTLQDIFTIQFISSLKFFTFADQNKYEKYPLYRELVELQNAVEFFTFLESEYAFMDAFLVTEGLRERKPFHNALPTKKIIIRGR